MYACEQTPRLTVHQESVSEKLATPSPLQRAEHEQATPQAWSQGSAAGPMAGRATDTGQPVSTTAGQPHAL